MGGSEDASSRALVGVGLCVAAVVIGNVSLFLLAGIERNLVASVLVIVVCAGLVAAGVGLVTRTVVSDEGGDDGAAA